MVFRHQIDVKGPRGGVRGVIPTKQDYLRENRPPSPLDY